MKIAQLFKKLNMERTINERECSNSSLFLRLKKNDKVHVSLKSYSERMIRKECSIQNRFAGCTPLNNKYTTTIKEKTGYITIYRRY